MFLLASNFLWGTPFGANTKEMGDGEPGGTFEKGILLMDFFGYLLKLPEEEKSPGSLFIVDPADNDTNVAKR